MRDFLVSAISFVILASTYWLAAALVFFMAEGVIGLLGVPGWIIWFCAGAAFVWSNPFKAIKKYSCNVFYAVQDFVWKKF
jgi:hypothetical protein